MSTISTALEASAAPERLIEIASVGKIAAEEGINAAHRAINIIKKDPQLTVIEGKALSQVTPGIDILIKSGKILDKGGLTSVGRALQKHGRRPGSVFPAAKGNTASINLQGEAILKEILTHQHTTSVIRHHARFGDILEYKIVEGKGARFSADGKIFIGFIEP